MTTTVNLIGTGRVGQTLLRCLSGQPDLIIQDVNSRRYAAAVSAVDATGQGRAVETLKQMRPADIWLLTVPDTTIASVADDLAAINLTPAIAVHCSGFHVAGVMAPLGAKGWHLASAHPMLSFADPEVSAARFPGTWVGMEGDADALDPVGGLFSGLGARTFRVSSEGKALYHAAAVITNNFTTVLQAVALETWERAGVPEEAARDLNATLLRSTLENIERLGPAEALTGPAARGDRAVVDAQAARVASWRADVGEVYVQLSEMAVRLKITGSTEPD